MGELHRVVDQLRTAQLASVLLVVTGQACGLAAFMRGRTALIELTPALDGPYSCRRGWDMNPTSEVGQVARLSDLHHQCVMADADGHQHVREDGTLTASGQDTLAWQTVNRIMAPRLTSEHGGLARILRQALTFSA